LFLLFFAPLHLSHSSNLGRVQKRPLSAGLCLLAGLEGFAPGATASDVHIWCYDKCCM